MRRGLGLVSATVCVVALTACGGQQPASSARRADATERATGLVLHVDGQRRRTTTARRVIIRGRTTPGAHLSIDRRLVAVSRTGAWHRSVALSLGTNAVTVQASLGAQRRVRELELTRDRTASERAALEARRRELREAREQREAQARERREAEARERREAQARSEAEARERREAQQRIETEEARARRAPTEHDELGSYSHATDAQFCSEHDCIGEFDSEPGRIAECADGSFSHSGGIQGACSYHGGVARE